MTPSSRPTGADATQPGPARSSRPWSTRPWWSPAPTPPQRCCPTWPGSSSPHALSGPMSPPRSVTLAGTHPHVPGPDHTCPGSGVPAAAVFLAETLSKTSRHRSPAGLLRRARSRHTPLRLIDPRRARLPRRQQEAQARHVPVRLRLTALRPRLPGLLPAQTRPGQAS